MILRCENPKNIAYKNYGGRGIAVCDRWHIFENFCADMGDRPLGMTLERDDNDGNYEPGNCRWATRAEQNRNTRQNRWATINGETACLTDFASSHDMTLACLNARLSRGVPLELALTLPKRPGRRLLA